MGSEALRLNVHFGDRDHREGRLTADLVMECFARHGVQNSMLLRGVEGFGTKHRLRSDELLTLSEDLPLIASALDAPARIETLLAEIRPLARRGLITLEQTQLLSSAAHTPGLASAEETAKLTIHLARHERAGGRAAYLAAVDCLHRHGLDGASVMLGLDGTLRGERQRAGMLARNRRVPLVVVSVGEQRAFARALPELNATLEPAQMTLEPVLVCKRDGVLLAAPEHPPAPVHQEGFALLQKLSVYSGERSRHEGQSLHGALIRRLRREGAAGATALRGIWGYHGDHQPHGERFWSIARHVPVQSVLIDTPANMRRWFAIVDELTAAGGLVTSELVNVASTVD